MRLQIRNKVILHGKTHTWGATLEIPGDYESVKHLQRALTERFKRHRSRRIKNGLIRIEGEWNDRRTFVMTQEDVQ